MTNSLYIAFRSDTESGQWGPVGRLDHMDGYYRFGYTRGAQQLEGFSPFPGMDDLGKVYESEKLFPLFANRLLSKSRPEYDAYLTWGGFDPNNPPDPIAILSVTEGRKQTDRYEVFPCPAPDSDGCFVTKFFLHGLSRLPAEAVQRVGNLRQEEQLELVPEPKNPADPNAVSVWSMRDENEQKLGYVPRYLARDISHIFETCDPDFIDVFVERVNVKAPMQQRLLCRMHACWPEGFCPCSNDLFEPIVTVSPTPAR